MQTQTLTLKTKRREVQNPALRAALEKRRRSPAEAPEAGPLGKPPLRAVEGAQGAAKPPPAEAPTTHKRRPRTEAEEKAYQWILDTFPVFQCSRRPLPLAIGVDKLIAAQRPEGIGVRGVKRFLVEWTRRREYLRALTQEGAQRHGLDGKPVEPVSDEHRAYTRRYGSRSPTRKTANPVTVSPEG